MNRRSHPVRPGFETSLAPSPGNRMSRMPVEADFCTQESFQIVRRVREAEAGCTGAQISKEGSRAVNVERSLTRGDARPH
jgi:hypothetical protein